MHLIQHAKNIPTHGADDEDEEGGDHNDDHDDDDDDDDDDGRAGELVRGGGQSEKWSQGTTEQSQLHSDEARRGKRKNFLFRSKAQDLVITVTRYPGGRNDRQKRRGTVALVVSTIISADVISIISCGMVV